MTKGCGPLHRTRCPPRADNSHVCGPRGIFPDVHAAGKNGSHWIRACGRELCEAFLTSWAPLPTGKRSFFRPTGRTEPAGSRPSSPRTPPPGPAGAPRGPLSHPSVCPLRPPHSLRAPRGGIYPGKSGQTRVNTGSAGVPWKGCGAIGQRDHPAGHPGQVPRPQAV